ncbi:hypothetical protein THAOC_02017, partial [Thalassiosira oceanica]
SVASSFRAQQSARVRRGDGAPSSFRPPLAAAAASEPPEDKTGRIDGRRAQLRPLSFWSDVSARQSEGCQRPAVSKGLGWRASLMPRPQASYARRRRRTAGWLRVWRLDPPLHRGPSVPIRKQKKALL